MKTKGFLRNKKRFVSKITVEKAPTAYLASDADAETHVNSVYWLSSFTTVHFKLKVVVTHHRYLMTVIGYWVAVIEDLHVIIVG
jgi:hypothetical protein